MTILGTLLANFLQYRAEQRHIKTILVKERFAEVRRYITTCLEFVDLVSIPTTIGVENLGTDAFAEWESTLHEHIEKWKDLPASGSARLLYVSDKEILEGLTQIDKLRVFFYFKYLDISDKRKVNQLDKERDELKDIAIRLGLRLDKLLSEI